MGSSDDNSWKLERNIPMRIPLLTLQPSLPIKKKKKPKKVGREFMKESPNLEMEEVDRRIWVHLLPHDHTLINKKVIQQTQFIHWDLLNFSDGKTVEKKQIGSSYFVVEPNKESRSVSPYRRKFMPLHVFFLLLGVFQQCSMARTHWGAFHRLHLIPLGLEVGAALQAGIDVQVRRGASLSTEFGGWVRLMWFINIVHKWIIVLNGHDNPQDRPWTWLVEEVGVGEGRGCVLWTLDHR